MAYDHRRDGYVGGLPTGYAGQVGVRGGWWLSQPDSGNAWGIQAELAVESALFGGLDLSYRWGSL